MIDTTTLEVLSGQAELKASQIINHYLIKTVNKLGLNRSQLV